MHFTHFTVKHWHSKDIKHSLVPYHNLKHHYQRPNFYPKSNLKLALTLITLKSCLHHQIAVWISGDLNSVYNSTKRLVCSHFKVTTVIYNRHSLRKDRTKSFKYESPYASDYACTLFIHLDLPLCCKVQGVWTFW